MSLTKQQKRRRFIDPQCKTCGPVVVAYAWRKNDRDRWRIRATCSQCKCHIKDFTRNSVPARIKVALKPEAACYEIRYPSKPTEFEVQAYLFGALRSLGFDARGEVVTKDGDCRFDIVVFADRKPVRIIEVKRSREKYRSRQIEQYAGYRIKVISVCGMEEANRLIETARAAGPRTPLPLAV